MNRTDLRHPQWKAAIASFCVFLLAGCGIGTQSNPIASTATIGGIIHGGPNPIVGATLNLYSTGTTGYGSGSTLLATTTSGSYGQYSFPANTCVAGSEVYVTAAGGNTGANTANANSLLMSAIGDCANVNSSTFTYISEMTTVAAAYALSNFTTITGSGASAVVNIGAPAANAAATPACTGTGSSMACTASGLKHAFANANNLVNPVSGAVYTTTPSNANGVVPAVLLNTIADIVQACVNSIGGAAGDGSGCGTLFTNTTPPTTSTITPVTPANTLQALINLAKYPNMTTAQVSALFLQSQPTAFFQPTLTAAPNDFSVAIYYTGVTVGSTTTAFVYPYYLALDYNDDVYPINATTSSAGPVTAAGMTSNGTSLYSSATITTSACQAGVPCVAAPDTTGTLWLAFGSTTNGSLYPINTATGSIGTAIAAGSGVPLAGVAVDRFNAVFASVPLASATNSIYSLPAGGSALSPVQANGAAISETAVPLALFFDGSGSLWNASKYTAGAAVSTTYLANSSSSTATAFVAAPVQTVDDAAANLHGGAYGLVVDSSGNGWTNGGGEANKTTASAYLYKATTANSTVTSTVIQNGSVFAVSPRYSAIDGANNIFIPDNNGSGASYIWQYLPATGNFVNLLPCAPVSTVPPAAAATTCSVTLATTTISGPRNAQVDSTGSIWISSSSNGHIVQIIGTAAPTWPQLSYGHPGVMPH